MYYYKVIKRRHTEVCYIVKGTVFYNLQKKGNSYFKIFTVSHWN